MAPAVRSAAPAPDLTRMTQTGIAASAATGTVKAKVCTTKGAAATAGVSLPWSITVSSDGGGCTHSREPARRNNVTFEVKQAPKHGQVTQQPSGPLTYVTYTPAPGYKGDDSFLLYNQTRGMDMPYSVTVVP